MTPNYPPPKRKSMEEMIAESNGFKDDSSTLTGEKPKFDWTFFFSAMAVMAVIFGIIIGRCFCG
jgi:hypothetical protein